MSEKERGLRYNSNKLRYDLLHPAAQKGIVQVLTKGASKYEPRNWEKGMPWSETLASMKRHIAAYESGEDYDPETGELHVDHIQCNAHFLSAFYTIAPQFDDRRHHVRRKWKIGLDIDGVIADFDGHLKKTYEGFETTYSWNDPFIRKSFGEVCKDDTDFILTMPPLILRQDLPFEPHCYITSRVNREATQKWLDDNAFPVAPLYVVGHDNSKVDVAKESGIDVFVDDHYNNYVELNSAGILCYLMDATYNRKYDVGYRRIHNLKELCDKINY